LKLLLGTLLAGAVIKGNNLTISAQNCNSFNLTGITTNLELKVAAISNCGGQM